MGSSEPLRGGGGDPRRPGGRRRRVRVSPVPGHPVSSGLPPSLRPCRVGKADRPGPRRRRIDRAAVAGARQGPCRGAPHPREVAVRIGSVGRDDRGRGGRRPRVPPANEPQRLVRTPVAQGRLVPRVSPPVRRRDRRDRPAGRRDPVSASRHGSLRRARRAAQPRAAAGHPPGERVRACRGRLHDAAGVLQLGVFRWGRERRVRLRNGVHLPAVHADRQAEGLPVERVASPRDRDPARGGLEPHRGLHGCGGATDLVCRR